MFHILLSLHLLAISNALLCSKTMTQGPFELKLPTQTLPNITRTRLLVTKFRINHNTAEMLIGFRSLWKAYCYQGGSLDQNTGCYSGLYNKAPSQDELLQWKAKGKCEICRDAHNKWGSDASVCTTDDNACGVWVDSKELKKETSNNNFAYHTCTLSWRCGFSSSRVPLMLEYDSNTKEPKIVIGLPNGTTTKVIELFHANEETTVYIRDIPRYIARVIEAQCVNDSGKFWCVDPEDHRDFLIDYNRKIMHHCLGDGCYVAKSRNNDAVQELISQASTASLGDLKKIFIQEMGEIEDLKYTVLQMAHRSLLMEKILHRMINSLAKIDDKLLGKLMGSEFSTDFLSDSAFMIKPCIRMNLGKSNCIGNKIYRDGRWVLNKDPMNCVNLQTVKPISLFEALDIWLPEIASDNLIGVPEQYAGWSFFASEKENLQDTMLFTRNGGKSTSLQDLLDYPQGAFHNMINGLFGVSFVTLGLIVIGGLLFCKVYKRL